MAGTTKQPYATKALLGACLALVMFLGLAAPVRAQSRGPIEYQPPPKKSGEADIRSTANLVLVPCTVTDPYDRLVTGLDEDNFRVFENNREQEIQYFAADDVPISIGVIFDVSGSMADKIGKSRLAAVQFFKTANPADEFFLVNFSARAELATPFTSSITELQNQLLYTGAKGRTALLDAVYLGLTEMKGAHNARKALLIISDGGDNHSRYDEADIQDFLRESDVQLYAIGVYEEDPCGDSDQPEVCQGPDMLRDLTDMTGGRTFVVKDLNELPDIATKISMELRNEYVLGYRPHNRKHDGKWRKIKVKIDPPRGLPPLTVYSRYGYYAPGP